MKMKFLYYIKTSLYYIAFIIMILVINQIRYCYKHDLSPRGQMAFVAVDYLPNFVVDVLFPDSIDDPNTKVTQSGKTLFHVACMIGNVERVQRMINTGAQIDGQAILALLQTNNINPEVLNLLINPNSMIDATYAITLNHYDMTRLLIESKGMIEGPLVVFITGRYMFAPVYPKYYNFDDFRVLTYLMSQGVDINAREFDHDETILHLAAAANDVELITFLLQHGADPTLQTDTGQTARDIAMQQDAQDVIKLL